MSMHATTNDQTRANMNNYSKKQQLYGAAQDSDPFQQELQQVRLNPPHAEYQGSSSGLGPSTNSLGRGGSDPANAVRSSLDDRARMFAGSVGASVDKSNANYSDDLTLEMLQTANDNQQQQHQQQRHQRQASDDVLLQIGSEEQSADQNPYANHVKKQSFGNLGNSNSGGGLQQPSSIPPDSALDLHGQNLLSSNPKNGHIDSRSTLANVNPAQSSGNNNNYSGDLDNTNSVAPPRNAGTNNNDLLTLDQYKANNAQLQQILMQMDSTPQFNYKQNPSIQHQQSAVTANSALHAPQPSSGSHNSQLSQKLLLRNNSNPQTNLINGSNQQMQHQQQLSQANMLNNSGFNQNSAGLTLGSKQTPTLSNQQMAPGQIGNGSGRNQQVNGLRPGQVLDPINETLQEVSQFKFTSEDISPGSNAAAPAGSSQLTSIMNQLGSSAQVKNNFQVQGQSTIPSQSTQDHFMGDNISTIQDSSKFDLLQQAIQNQTPSQQLSQNPPLGNNQNYRQTFKPLQNAGNQIMMQNAQQTQNSQLQPASHQQPRLNQMTNNNNAPNKIGQPASNFTNGPQNENVNDMNSSLEEDQYPKTKPQFEAPDKQTLLQQHHQIMQNFDDIPINKIKTMVGYQTNPDLYDANTRIRESQSLNNLDEAAVVPPNAQQQQPGANPNLDDEIAQLSIYERVKHKSWKVRLEVFKEINTAFYTDFAESQTDPDAQMTSFHEYGPYIQEMLQDTNLTLAFEAMQVLYTYIRFAKDIKSISFSIHNFLLEKVQVNKPNFRDLNQKILTEMINRDQASYLLPELIKRFKVKNTWMALFNVMVVIEAFKIKEAQQGLQQNLRQMFNATQVLLTHPHKDLRENAYALIKQIFARCRHSPSEFVEHCKNLRPVQVKELTEMLNQVEKTSDAIQNAIFDNDQNLEKEGAEGNLTARGPSQVQKQGTHVSNGTNDEQLPDQEVPVQPVEQELIDLLTLIPDDFSEIAYMNQINAKKKSMESFNNELQMLVDRKLKNNSVIVKQKDYSAIYNTIIHMLEDKNMLVFLEAIKTVIHLATLLGQAMVKTKQTKTFFNLIANKYGETKTAVISGVEKALTSLSPPVTSTTAFTELCMLVATTHKNPRVKQFMIDHTLDQFLKRIDVEQAVVVFEKSSAKLVQIILKDTNNSVRDAAVNLLVEFKIKLADGSSNAERNEMVEKAVKELPKYRIQEINKKTEAVLPTTAETEHENKPDDPWSKTIQPVSKQDTTKSEMQVNEETDQMHQQQDEGYSKTMQPQKPQQNQIELSFGQQIQQLLKKFKQGDFSSEPNQLQQSWSDKLASISLEDLQSEKPELVKAIRISLATTQGFRRNLLHMRCLLSLLRQIYTVDQQVFVNQNSNTSDELLDLILASLIHNKYTMGQEGVDQTAGETSQMLLIAMFASPSIHIFFDCLRAAIESPQVMQCECGLGIVKQVYIWMGLKLKEFLKMGFEMQDLEEQRALAIKYLETPDLLDEQQRQQLINIMIRFKDQVKALKGNSGEDHQSRPQTSHSQQQNQRPGTSQSHQSHQSNMMMMPEQEINADLICQVIDKEFEKGLLMFKQMAQQQGASLSFETKHQIFSKLLSIVSDQPSNQAQAQQQQYRQAYALKALMWMKEETMGVEDSFKLSPQVLQAYSQQIQKDGDASVELYLLNFWVKDHQVRDLCDRIAYAVSSQQQQKQQQQAQPDITSFDLLVEWFKPQILEPLEKWSLSDLRKIGVLLATSALKAARKSSYQDKKSDVAKSLIEMCIQKEGREKVVQTLEIQLMNSNDLLINFLDWFNNTFPDPNPKTQPQSNNEHLQIKNIGASKVRKNSFEEAAAQRITPRGQEADVPQSEVITPRGGSRAGGDPTLSYSQRRNLMKQNAAQGVQEIEQSSQQVQEIIQRLESAHSRQQESSHKKQPMRKLREQPQSKTQEDQTPLLGQSTQESVPPHTAVPTTTDYQEQEKPLEVLRNTSSSAYYQSIGRDRYKQEQPTEGDSSEGEVCLDADPNQNRLQESELEEQKTHLQSYLNEQQTQQIASQNNVNANAELQAQLHQDYQNKVKALEEEKLKLERETFLLEQEKNSENEVMQRRLSELQNEHQMVVGQLQEVNQRNHVQNTENDQLKEQLTLMQQQHVQMMNRFTDIERKINSSEADRRERTPDRKNKIDRDPITDMVVTPTRASNQISNRKDNLMVSVQKLQRISDTFDFQDESASQLGVMKIQELLLSVERNVDGELAKPLTAHYINKLKTEEDRFIMIQGLSEALSHNEDVLLCLSVDVYKAVLNFLLLAFAHEKEILDRSSVATADKKNALDQNQITTESQKMVSRMLNSKDFTTSLVVLFQLLKEAMPESLEADMSVRERQYLRVVMRCIMRIGKALHSESADLIRAFDVFIEMYKIFVQNPPEQLREDLPCLADFDFVYRGMKDVSDKLVDLQPEKVLSFLKFKEETGKGENAFIKYLKQAVAQR